MTRDQLQGKWQRIKGGRCTLVAIVGVALFAGGCSSSAPNSPTTPCTPTPTNPECVNPPNLLTVTITSGVFSPNPVMVKVGQSVNWHDSDSIAHTATDPGVFDTGSIAPFSAADRAVLFSTVGTYNYRCTLHANENASIVVISSTSAHNQQTTVPRWTAVLHPPSGSWNTSSWLPIRALICVTAVCGQ